ncbi:MAG: HEAT repeat domain-containing protein [Myxococcales bacterium]|nr:HEAT repeat domain-containing protein [Myxococcales bacterium]
MTSLALRRFGTHARGALVCLLGVWLLTTGFEWEGRLARLERELENADVSRRVEVVRMLGSYPADEVRGPLLRALEDADPTVRREAAAVAGQVRLRDALPMLLEWLEDPDSDVRSVAATSLGRLRETAARDALVRALGDAEASVRRAAVGALVELGDTHVLVPILGRLDDLDPDVRVEAARGLARLRDVRAVVPLVGRARDDSVSVRQAVVAALGALGDARAVPTLTLALRDDDEDVRLAAMGALGRLGDPSASPELVALAREGEPRTARAALSALGAIAGERALDAAVEALVRSELRAIATEVLLQPTDVATTVALAERLPGDERRDHATALASVVLRRLEREPAPAAANPLLRALRADDASRPVLIRALGASGDVSVLVPILTELERDDEAVRLAALEALETYFRLHPADGRAADPLLAALGRVPPSARERVVRLLGRVGARRATTAVRPLLESRDPSLRLAAVETLGALGDPRGAEALEPLLDADEGAVRHAAASALGRLADDALVARVVTRLRDRAPVHRHALLALAEKALARGVAGDPAQTRAALEGALSHPDRSLASSALLALAAWSTEEVAARLRALAEDPSFRHRDLALRALATRGSDATRTTLRAVADDEDATPRVRAAAVAALGPAGDESDLARLVAWTRTLQGPLASAAAFGLAQRARGLADDARSRVEAEAVCALLSRRDAYVRANVIATLTTLGHRCDGRPASLYLDRANAEAVRAAAARWAHATGGEDDALARCATDDLAPSVAHACAEAPSHRPDTHTDVHAFAGDGRTLLRDALVALRFSDGTALVGWTDTNGRMTWPAVPEGALLLDDPLRVPLQP